MDNDIQKNLALYEELETSIRLIQIGFGEIQNLDVENNFRHLPFQLISSGFERLMKCHICLGHIELHGQYPVQNLFKHKLKHDLIIIKKHIITEYFKTENITALEEDLKYIASDQGLNYLIELLSEFGKFARYYNLDVVTGAKKPSIDVDTLWKEYETKLLIEDKDLLDKVSCLEKQNEVLGSINRSIIIKFERFIRAIVRQFTLGKLGSLAQQYSPAVHPFLMLQDSDLGSIDYRKNTTRYSQKKSQFCKRTLVKKIRSKIDKNYSSKTIKKPNFIGDWPFYNNEIIIECREKHWCVVIIDGYEYALNGSAKGRYKLEDVHEAGMAILGKSTGAFITMALELGELNAKN